MEQEANQKNGTQTPLVSETLLWFKSFFFPAKLDVHLELVQHFVHITNTDFNGDNWDFM